MPRPVPETRYGRDTPDVAEFYSMLAAGMSLTLAGETAELARLQERVAELEPVIQAAEKSWSPLKATHEEAVRAVQHVQGAPPPRSGIKGLISAAQAAEAAALAARAEADELLLDRDRLLRGIELRTGLAGSTDMQDGSKGVGTAPFGVYAFYDYDGRAMYVGRTTEGVSTRVRRHLTNQRSDAVAMGVLDPLEVVEVEVWPLWPQNDAERDTARAWIAGLEYAVEQACISRGDVLFNEKRIPAVAGAITMPRSVRFDTLSPETRARLGHPDLRIARRSAISARLSGKIVERSLKNVGLRRSLGRQLQRLTELASARFEGLGGEQAVTVDTGKEDSADD